ncbi:MAG: 50S ribosomal protein L13 [Phycisphaeraceae bacterium]
MNRQTYHAKNGQVKQSWWMIDASDQVLGRLSVKLAMILMGKNKPQYTPHHDVGDFVVVTNADKIRLTGAKPDNKFFQTFSGYSGGQKRYSYRWMLEHKPELLLQRSVRRMLPKNRLARKQLSKLKIYRGTEHPHQAQQPEPLTI